MAKATWIGVLASAAIIGGLIGAGSVGITSAEGKESQLQAVQAQTAASVVQTANQTAAASAPTVVSTVAPTASPAASTSTRASESTSVITAKQAGEIAAKHVQGTVVEIDRDKEWGKLYYEVELRVQDGEAEVKVDAQTGKVVNVEYDRDDNDDLDDDDDDCDNCDNDNCDDDDDRD